MNYDVYYLSYNGDESSYMSLDDLLTNLRDTGVDQSIRDDIELSIQQMGFWLGDIGFESAVICKNLLKSIDSDSKLPVPPP